MVAPRRKQLWEESIETMRSASAKRQPPRAPMSPCIRSASFSDVGLVYIWVVVRVGGICVDTHVETNRRTEEHVQ